MRKKGLSKAPVAGWRLGTILLIVVSTLTSASCTRFALWAPTVPLPEWATDVVERRELLWRRWQAIFRVPFAYPDTSTLDFYAAWAQSQGWVEVTPAEEHWPSSGWFEIIDVMGVPPLHVFQWFAHWRSPDSKWSLRVILRAEAELPQNRPPSSETVIVLVEPFWLLPKKL